MKTLASLHIQPRVFNTPIPWASNLELLRKLYECPHTGAITTRTSMLNGFPDNPAVNQYVLFNPSSQQSATVSQTDDVTPEQNASLNTIVFSPFTLDQFLGFVQALSDEQSDNQPHFKPVIVSITGTAEEVAIGYGKVNALQNRVKMPLAVEVNLSCPNVPGKASPAYDGDALLDYLLAIKQETQRQQKAGEYNGLPIGVKFPPFTYQDQYDVVFATLLRTVEDGAECPIAFITSTNTLGSALVVNGQNGESVLKSIAGTGIGGMAGAPIHALSLGNVLTIRQMLDAEPKLKHLEIIGVGGVSDHGGYLRMRSVGADFVGVGTAIGVKGLQVFADIAA